jgi:hypothetical protein
MLLCNRLAPTRQPIEEGALTPQKFGSLFFPAIPAWDSKNVPGRENDVKDAEWDADLLAYGLSGRAWSSKARPRRIAPIWCHMLDRACVPVTVPGLPRCRRSEP